LCASVVVHPSSASILAPASRTLIVWASTCPTTTSFVSPGAAA
jgi:hypothetical protein